MTDRDAAVERARKRAQQTLAVGSEVALPDALDEATAERDQARAKNTELHRRCQLAESAVRDRVATCPDEIRDSRGLGRRLLGAAYGIAERENVKLREALTELAAEASKRAAMHPRYEDPLAAAIERARAALEEEPAS